METLLQVKDLETTFTTTHGKVYAVRGVSFDIGKGESLGMVGESGSGKSITAMSILRLLPENGKITNGQLLLEGKDIVRMSRKQLRELRGSRVAMVFQDPMTSLNPLIPIGQQIDEMLWAHQKELHKDKRKERVLELLSLVRIPEPETRYNSLPHEFSGGMRQRVIIAMALACNPDLLIADEPTTALDVTIQDQILRLLHSLQRDSGTGIIIITHDLSIVAGLCSRVIVMYGGLIMEEAPVSDLFHKPMHPYTRGLLNSIPSIKQDKTKKLIPIPGSPPDMTNPPKGCPFAWRCRWARRICASEKPPYFYRNENHRSMCWLLSDDAPLQDNPFKEVKV